MQRDDERNPFYVGIRPCGCVTAAMVDDETTRAEDVAEFATEMANSGRRVEHRNLTRNEFVDVFSGHCPHEQPNTGGNQRERSAAK